MTMNMLTTAALKMLVHDPLRYVYQYCYHGGSDAATICGGLTSYSAEFWARNAADCERLITQRVDGIQAGVAGLYYFGFLFYVGTAAAMMLGDLLLTGARETGKHLFRT